MREIYAKKWYTPLEIAKLGLIKNSRGEASTVASNYNYILQLIKTGRIRAKNYSSSQKRAFWLVPEDEIVRYHDTVSAPVREIRDEQA